MELCAHNSHKKTGNKYPIKDFLCFDIIGWDDERKKALLVISLRTGLILPPRKSQSWLLCWYKSVREELQKCVGKSKCSIPFSSNSVLVFHIEYSIKDENLIGYIQNLLRFLSYRFKTKQHSKTWICQMQKDVLKAFAADILLNLLYFLEFKNNVQLMSCHKYTARKSHITKCIAPIE